MEQKKRKINYLYVILILLFIVFISLYFSQINGYYEYKQYNKMSLTQEAMKQFENDVESGKEINITNYLDTTYKDYSNSVSKLGLKASEAIEYVFKKGIKRTFKVIGTLFVD